jgi:starch-binding outer membrane protein, SusD/RagB family
MKKILFVFVFLGLVQLSCTKLDDKLYDRIPPEEFTADPVLQMSVIYEPMREFLDWGGWWFANELTGDGAVGPTRDTDWDDGGKWRKLHLHDWDDETEAINSMWSRFYSGIVEANKFIEAQAPFEGDPIVDQAIAKAKVLRAYYYYLAIDNYGDVPYVDKYLDADANPKRNHRAEIFDRIVKEVEESTPLIQFSTSRTGVGKGAAFSLLTKLYLNHAVYTGAENPAYWAKAEQYADSVIQLGIYSLESDALAPFVTNNHASSENIWIIPFDEDTYQGFNLHMRTLHYNHNLTFEMVAGPWNGFAAMESHFNTYADNDRRKEGFLYGPQFTSSGEEIVDGVANAPLVIDPYIPALEMTVAQHTAEQIRMSGARVAKFEIKKGAKDNLSNAFPIFRYADVLLMKAEAMIRQGMNGDEYVNLVRTRAGLDAWSGVTLEQLLEERGREMFWEAHRRQDLIRFGQFTRAWWEKPASNDARKVFPIPLWAREANPNLDAEIVSLNP